MAVASEMVSPTKARLWHRPVSPTWRRVSSANPRNLVRWVLHTPRVTTLTCANVIVERCIGTYLGRIKPRCSGSNASAIYLAAVARRAMAFLSSLCTVAL